MGFDLHGVNPKMNMEIEEFPVYGKYSKLSFKERWKALDKDEKLRKQFWKEQEDYEYANPGIYFRNNVWGWRPLWQFVCNQFPEVINDKDAEGGESNSGHLIDKSKAMRIGYGLKAKLLDGSLQTYCDNYKKELDSLEQEECYLCEGTGTRTDMKVDNGCNGCSGTGKRDSWAKSYPFDIDNVRYFLEFCLESGGFEIC